MSHKTKQEELTTVVCRSCDLETVLEISDPETHCPNCGDAFYILGTKQKWADYKIKLKESTNRKNWTTWRQTNR